MESQFGEIERTNEQLRRRIEELSSANRRVNEIDILAREKNQLEERIVLIST